VAEAAQGRGVSNGTSSGNIQSIDVSAQAGLQKIHDLNLNHDNSFLTNGTLPKRTAGAEFVNSLEVL
jgi:hypothetical protein